MAGPSRSVPLQLAGVVVALAGLAAGAYAYSGDRIYDVAFLFVTLLGLLLLGGGIALAAWGRALAAAKPRKTGVTPTPPVKAAPAEAEPAPPKEPLLARVKSRLPVRSGNGKPATPETAPAERPVPRVRVSAKAARKAAAASASQAVVKEVPDAPVERVDLRCPGCSREFTAEGRRPFDTRCPGCGMLADVE